MPNYIPKAEQIDSLNEKLTAINDTLKKKNDFTDAIKNLKNVTTKAEEATEKATTAAESVVSPSATVTKSGDTATITVTDKTGTTTAEVKDGSDATVTKDAVVGALGYIPQTKETGYKHLRTVKLTESIKLLTVNTDEDGNSLKLSHAYIKVTHDGSITTNKSFTTDYLIKNDKSEMLLYIYPPLVRASQEEYSILWGHAYGDRTEYEFTYFSTENDLNGELKQSTKTMKILENSWIYGFSFYSGAGIPAGLIIEFYGIQA